MPSYLTPAEYLAAPTAVDTNNLVSGGGAAAQAAALVTVIAKASAWIDNECNQTLLASTDIEFIPGNYQRNGFVVLHPRRAPLNTLTSLALGTHAGNQVTVSDLSGAYVNHENWVIPAVSSGVSLSFGSTTGRFLAKLTHVAGWSNTVLTSSPIVGATSFTVANTAGFLPAPGSFVWGDDITIYDGVSTEVITVTAVVGSTLTCSPLTFSHSAGVAVSMLPSDIKEAAVMVTSAFIRSRQADALVMSNITTAPGQSPPQDAPRARALYDASKMLRTYGRVR